MFKVEIQKKLRLGVDEVLKQQFGLVVGLILGVIHPISLTLLWKSERPKEFGSRVKLRNFHKNQASLFVFFLSAQTLLLT